MLKWLIVALVCYVGVVALLYVGQRALQYFPERFRTAPAAAGRSPSSSISTATAHRCAGGSIAFAR
jgi:hypothetical protein